MKRFSWGGERSTEYSHDSSRFSSNGSKNKRGPRPDQLQEPSGSELNVRKCLGDISLASRLIYLFRKKCSNVLVWPGFAASMASIPLNSSSAQMLRLFGVKMLLGVNNKTRQTKKTNSNKLEKHRKTWPNIAKERHSSTTRGTVNERPEFVNAPKPTVHRQRQTWTHSHHGNGQQHHIWAPDAKGCTSLHVRGQKTRLVLPRMMKTRA